MFEDDFTLEEFETMGAGESEEEEQIKRPSLGLLLTSAVKGRTKNTPFAKTTVWNNNYWTRPKKFDKVFVHIMVAVWTGKRCGEFFRDHKVSSNYEIGYLGDICQSVEEKYGAWAQGSKTWNQRAVSIELSNTSIKDPSYPVSDETLEACIELVADIFIRNKMGHVNYTGDLNGNLCKHKWVASTSCPGAYMDKMFPIIEDEANKIIDGKMRLHMRGYYKKGDYGRSVKALKKWLKKKGFYKGISLNRTYSTATVKAVERFQKKYGLKVDGEWGKECYRQYKKLEK